MSAKNLQCPDITVATSVFLSNKVLLLMCLEIMQRGRKIKASQKCVLIYLEFNQKTRATELTPVIALFCAAECVCANAEDASHQSLRALLFVCGTAVVRVAL